MLCLDQRVGASCSSGFEQKKKSRCALLIESLLDHFSLFRFWTLLQHVGFFDMTSDKTNQQIGEARHDPAHFKVGRCVWTLAKRINELVDVGVRGTGGVLFCLSASPLVISLCFKSSTPVTNTLSDGRAVKSVR